VNSGKYFKKKVLFFFLTDDGIFLLDGTRKVSAPPPLSGPGDQIKVLPFSGRKM
jgi:hypothetical protein